MVSAFTFIVCFAVGTIPEFLVGLGAWVVDPSFIVLAEVSPPQRNKANPPLSHRLHRFRNSESNPVSQGTDGGTPNERYAKVSKRI